MLNEQLQRELTSHQRTKELLLAYKHFVNRIDDLSQYRGRGISHHQCKDALDNLSCRITQLKRTWDKEDARERKSVDVSDWLNNIR